MTKNEIIISLQKGINPYEEYYIEDKVMEAMLGYPNPFELVAPILEIIESNPDIDFGTPGDLVHFVEKFYKKGYEEELLLSLKRMPTLHTVWMLNRLINGTDQAEVYLDLLKGISENASCDKEIREEALHFLSIH